MSGTEIINCQCKHICQDQIYGEGKRVANVMRTGQLKCTVCGTVGGTKSTFVKPATTAATPAPAEKSSKKESGAKERRSSKFKSKEKKPSAKDAPKGEISKKKSMKSGKKTR